VTKRFCDKNGLDAIIRSHEVRMDGYEEEHDGKCITGMFPFLLNFDSDCSPNHTQSSRHPSTVTRQRTEVLTSTSVPITSFISTSLMPFHILRFAQWVRNAFYSVMSIVADLCRSVCE
jgi:hypothetical protein